MITVLLVGLILGWVVGVITGHCLGVTEQCEEVLRLLQDHVYHHRSQVSENGEKEWWENWERN